ncbi:hypothetical protein LCGC14_0458780 [marine sediment metagenome]|uniref:Uncharacterized protein n=1 Tax=marine sediment metagenome TaxID=412755 RepID=A0A0F9SFQ4_9ZZZZ
MKQTVLSPPDCNRCDRKGCNPVIRPKFGDPYLRTKNFSCKGQVEPRSGWQLAELALAHPTSLNESLSSLDFEVNLNFYLR